MRSKRCFTFALIPAPVTPGLRPPWSLLGILPSRHLRLHARQMAEVRRDRRSGPSRGPVKQCPPTAGFFYWIPGPSPRTRSGAGMTVTMRSRRPLFRNWSIIWNSYLARILDEDCGWSAPPSAVHGCANAAMAGCHGAAMALATFVFPTRHWRRTASHGRRAGGRIVAIATVRLKPKSGRN